MSTLQLKNPHSIIAALSTRPKDVSRITLGGHSAKDDPWERVATLARKHGIPLQQGGASPGRDSRGGRDRDRDRDGGRTGAAEATVRPREPVSIEELFQGARERSGGKGLWLALDSLQDPQNVGAIFRTAGFFGVEGILMTTERSAPLTAAAYDVASGGIESVPFAQQVNLQRAFEIAKEQGLWILGSSEHAHDDLESIERDRPWLLVLGNEEKGIRRLTEEACDLMCKISSRGGVTSLNVSVAAGVFISRLAPRA
jgi:23S rRNA (guanosine2251-2'-O)-methyltransferase